MRAVVIGAAGGIGRALVEKLEASGRYDQIYTVSRDPAPSRSHTIAMHGDVTDEASIVAAANAISAPLDLVIVATGMLHEKKRMPEKSLRDIDGTALARIFAVNTIGPALALKHFVPLLAKDRRVVIAALSARVGSITDNRSGGWYGYRASKAALNMIVRSAAIELARAKPKAICVALHPGTVDTPLSQPFQLRVPPEKLFAPERAAAQLLAVIDGLTSADAGKLVAWDGSIIEP